MLRDNGDDRVRHNTNDEKLEDELGEEVLLRQPDVICRMISVWIELSGRTFEQQEQEENAIGEDGEECPESRWEEEEQAMEHSLHKTIFIEIHFYQTIRNMWKSFWRPRNNCNAYRACVSLRLCHGMRDEPDDRRADEWSDDENEIPETSPLFHQMKDRLLTMTS